MAKSREISGIVINEGKGSGAAVVAINGVVGQPMPDGPYVVVAEASYTNIGALLQGANGIGLVIDTGSADSPAADIARKGRIPCVVDIAYASLRVDQGDVRYS
jgi:phosphohistidine swiveling domain-containing protein